MPQKHEQKRRPLNDSSNSKRDEMYDDEFVVEDSYEMDSFEVTTKKQETIADVSAPKVVAVQKTYKTTEFEEESG